MNEVTKIHLGRQAFTIAADAHKELRNYLDAIKDRVNDKDVMEEVELRMAELLAEHGIAGDKVILAKDVKFLKSQLGNPADFDEDGEAPQDDSELPETKRLFRDTDNAILAGVAAGLAKYFGVDVLLIRILFVIGVFTGGWGILIYIALWLLVPEAKTSSERLQMAGKPVTVSSLKEVVSRADVAGAAKRANNSLAGPINSAFIILLKVVGVGFIVAGLSLLFALIAMESYVLAHTGNLFGQDIFPVGFREHLLLNLGVSVMALVAVLVIVFGISIFKQKWAIKTWVTGTLVGLILIGLAGTIALGADAAPQIRDRYNAHLHTSLRYVQPFTTVNTIGDGVNVRYEAADKYSVSLNYFDNPNLADIKTTVSNGTLLIDSTQFDWHRNCPSLCIPDTYDMIVTVKSPNMPQIDNKDEIVFPSPGDMPMSPVKPARPSMVSQP